MKNSPGTGVITQRVTLPEGPTMGCPLQQAMEEIAQVAVQQHVLYLEGESQPRPELLARLETWTTLHRLIRLRICTASRDTAIPAVELEGALGELFPQQQGIARHLLAPHLRDTLTACARATSCPLGVKVAERCAE